MPDNRFLSEHIGQVAQIIADYADDFIRILDKHGHIQYASLSHERILGYPVSDYQNVHVAVTVHPDDADVVRRCFHSIAEHKSVVRDQWRYGKSDGSYLWVEVIAVPITSSGHEVTNILIIGRDVTVKRRKEEVMKGQNEVLALTAGDESVEGVCAEIARQIESLNPNVRCAFAMSDGKQWTHVAPSMDTEQQHEITALRCPDRIQKYLNDEVFISRYTTDPQWTEPRDWLIRNQFEVVWSKPIYASDGLPIGVFSLLFTEWSEAERDFTSLYDSYAQIAALAVERTQVKRGIEESEQRYKSLFDINLNAVYEFDLNGRFIHVNKGFEETFGYTQSELYGMHFLDVVAPESAAEATTAFGEALLGNPHELEISAFNKNGKRLRLEVVCLPIRVNGEVTGTFGIIKDVTGYRYSEALLKNQKRVLEMIAKGSALDDVLQELTKIVEYHSPDAMCNVFLLNADKITLRHVKGNPKLKTYSKALGIVTIGPNMGACGTAPYLNQTVIVEDIKTDPLYDGFRQVSLQHGLQACCATPIVSSNGDVLGTFGLYYDSVKRPSKEEVELLKMSAHLAGLAVERKQAYDEIWHLAHNDVLTGLPNRTQFYEKLETALRQVSDDGHKLAVMFLDLDGFKAYNDSMGHHFGDKLLRMVADRVKSHIGCDHVLARMGGDEFTILLPGIEDSERAVSVATSVIQCFADPIEIDGYEFRLTVSIGIVLFPEHGDTSETLMRKADTAMYAAKGHGKNTFCIYSDAMGEKFHERLMVESALRHGIDNDEFVLHFQPRIDVKTKTVTSVEALLRWNRLGARLIPPDDFIPVAEETGLIVPMGRQVLVKVCEQIKTWESAGKKLMRIAVNVSPRQFQEPDFLQMVRSVISESGVNPTWLEIEVTESGLMEDEDEVMDILHTLQALGVKTSIDDFGVGYSSLNRLRKMPVDALKIDKSFIRDMFLDDAMMTKTIIDLAHNLRLTVIAEGVESEEQFQRLQEFGCDEIQGYLISPPVPIGEFEGKYMLS